MLVKNYFKTFILFILLSLSLSSCAAVLDSYIKEGTDFSKYKKISVVKFDSSLNTSIGQEVADVIALEFLKSGYQVIERSQLKSVIDEEALRLSGLTDASKSALKILGVNAIITGSIARYECIPSEVKFQDISIGTNNCSVALALKMLDIETGEIIWAANGTHSSNDIQMTEHKVLQEIIKKLYKQIPIKPENNEPQFAVVNPTTAPTPLPVQTVAPTVSPTAAPVEEVSKTPASNDADTRFNQANLLSGQGKLAEAINEYKEVLKINPGHIDSYLKLASAHAKLGIQYYHQHKLDEAVGQYQESLKINPSNYDTYNNMGVAYFALNKLDEAVNAYTEAIKLRSDFASAHDNLGLTYQKQGKMTEAVSEYKIACKLGMRGTCDWLRKKNY